MAVKLQEGFRLGPFEVVPQRNRIAGPGGETRVEPKTMAVLLELAAAAGGTVDRESLIRAVWPRGFVTDDVLTRCVGQLRKALGDSARTPRFLETVPKTGYRLVAPVRPRTQTTPEQPPAGEGVVVLPFQNLSASGQDQYVADGLTELLIARLAQASQLRVISRTTAMSLKDDTRTSPEIAGALGVRWLVEGSVLMAGGQMQIVAQLIDADHDRHVWADTWLRGLADLMPVQNEMARRIAAEICGTLATDLPEASEAPVLPEAVLRQYLKGRVSLSQRTPKALREARERFSRVVEAAPDYAPAWASLAETDMLLAHYGAEPVAAAVGRSRRHVDRALSLDPDLPMALAQRAALAFFFDRDFEGARAQVTRALELQPSYILALLTRANVNTVMGRFDDALGWIDQALSVDPLDLGIHMNRGDHLILHRRFSEAVTQLDAILARAPGHEPSRLRLAWALALDGRGAEARAALAQASGAAAALEEYGALVAGAADDMEAAAACYSKLRNLAGDLYVAPWALARAAAAAGDADAALAALEAALEEGSSSLPFAAVTPAFDRLRGDARFSEFLDRLGLPPAAPSAAAGHHGRTAPPSGRAAGG
jgi:TolB-like protein/Tfp pilus assembly protein PilF